MLIDDDKVVKLIDFGISRTIDNKNVNTQVGTEKYVPPEYWHNKYNEYSPENFAQLDKLDQEDILKKDVWSLGIMLYKSIIDNKLPPNIQEGQIKHLRSEDLSPECKDLITRMLVQTPRDRISISDVYRHPWFFSKKNRNALRDKTAANRAAANRAAANKAVANKAAVNKAAANKAVANKAAVNKAAALQLINRFVTRNDNNTSNYKGKINRNLGCHFPECTEKFNGFGSSVYSGRTHCKICLNVFCITHADKRQIKILQGKKRYFWSILY